MGTHKANVKKFFEFIRQPYAWPGGYEISMICDDGGIICHKCAKENKREIVSSIVLEIQDGWSPMGYDVLWEGGNHCDHCSKVLDNYGEEEN
jgi:hypothetical protein